MVGSRLGKGLRALIPEIPPDEGERAGTIQEVDVRKVSPNPFQPRENFDELALEELKNSIAQKGVIQPITVRIANSGYQLIAGERRLRAVIALGLETIPAYVLDVTSDEEMLELSLIENIQREDLNPIDLARAYQRLLTECNLRQEDVARKVGKDRSTITNFLRLLKLPELIQESLRKKELDMGHARALITLEDKDLQLKLWKKIIKDKLSVRKVEDLVKAGTKVPQKSEPTEKPFFILEAENKLREILGTRVTIRTASKGGKIEVEFYSKEELERILDLMGKI